jgi:hypothetical protein
MERFPLTNKTTQTDNDLLYKQQIGQHFTDSTGEVLDKLNTFTRFVSRQSLSLFLAKNEIFKRILNVHGNIIECGVFRGSGLMSWAQLSAIYEPINHIRKVTGFDTFEGFQDLHAADVSANSEFEHKLKGSYTFEHIDEIKESVRLFDLNRPVGHLQKVELVKGDATKTIPQYIKENQHLVVALLYLDFDLYEPTKVAIENFLPRMPKGAIIAFDELNQKQWPGETKAVLDTIGIGNLHIERFPFVPQLSFAQIK